MNNLKEIWHGQALESEKQIRTFVCKNGNADFYLASNKITGQRLFLIKFSSETNTAQFKNISFRGLAIQILDFEAFKELTIILHDDDLEDIFISFLEDILSDTTPCGSPDEVLTTVSNVIFQWKKLFDRAANTKLSIESEKGLFGEMLFFRDLINEGYTPEELENCWNGPNGGTQDFNFPSTSIEIKLTSAKHPSIRISNERQLEPLIDQDLYLFLYEVEESVSAGITLPILLREIKIFLASDQALENFNKKLSAYGYQQSDEELYLQKFINKTTSVFKVSEDFPRIKMDELSSGIFNVNYHIELGVCEPFKIELTTIKSLIHGN